MHNRSQGDGRTWRWLPRVLARVHQLASERKVRLTAKATREMAELGPGLDLEDVREALIDLTLGDSAGRRASRVTGEWMYVFKPQVA